MTQKELIQKIKDIPVWQIIKKDGTEELCPDDTIGNYVKNNINVISHIRLQK